ncbi:MAG: hypothetical protein M0C28_46600 [Candidatus Moduliflexus flocculans]|nr:hypothetical protein [Candidatus Moduliflexus flocculans]
MREAFRRHKPAPGLDIVVIPRREMLGADFGPRRGRLPRRPGAPGAEAAQCVTSPAVRPSPR